MNKPGRQYRYQEPDATMTLREGHAEYCAANNLLDPDAFESEKAAELFACHDHCHIVFGTNTDIIQEGMTDFWTMWGADVGVKRYMEYLEDPVTKQFAKDLMKQFTWREIIWDQLCSLPYYWRIWRASKRMKKKWEFFNYAAYLDTPLNEIRETFGIELVELPPIRRPVTAEMPAR